MPSQHEDVHFAERRFVKPDGYGVLFTNGTGTGKTFLGLGSVLRMVRSGRPDGLVVVPNDAVMTEWTRSAKLIGLDITPLNDTSDAGKGVAITTYANLANNRTLADRDINFFVADEAHNLMSNAQAEATSALRAMRAITLHPDGVRARAEMIERDAVDRMEHLANEIDMLRRLASKDDTMEAMRADYLERARDMEIEHSKLADRFKATLEAQQAKVDAAQNETRPRALFLSATPFAYERNTDWAQGYLFQYPARDESRSLRYNEPGPRESFMVQHFGYRMRHNKLTEPDAKVDRGLMQRQFNTWLRKQGVLSARMLDVEKDYDRKFVLIDGGIGTRIDHALKWLREAHDGLYHVFYDTANGSFDYLSRSRLLEAIKAKAAVPYIKAQHALGRKVVVFYDYNEGGGFNPFDFSGNPDTIITTHVRKGDGKVEEVKFRLGDFQQEFAREFPDLVGAAFEKAMSPLETLTQAFPKAAVYNGVVHKGSRQQGIDDFNNDHKPESNLLIVQSAANAGWSGHDTTGKFQRVVVNLGLPVAPTKAIQQEGRIYRVGQASNALFRYFNTGTLWERMAFAEKVARRASTAENLAMGEDARGLLQSFLDAFQDSAPNPPSVNEGTGGKAQDRALASTLSEFDRAKSFYYGQLKKNSSTKAQEGTDYYATPEPIGLKMVEWLHPEPGDRLLEPSAGHGAIARWFPESTQRTVIEPSLELASRLGLITDAKQINSRFEDLHITNKFEGIAMNPPFGVGGKTAVEHVAKAFTHLPDGGRMVAIIPEGPAADGRFDGWLNAQDANGKPLRPDARLIASISLPGLVFERAGTKVATRIVIIDKLSDKSITSYPVNLDLTSAKNIGDVFDMVENLDFMRARSSADVQQTQPAEAAATKKHELVVDDLADATFEVKGDKLLTDAPQATYTTKDGKELVGVYVPDPAIARKVDKFTFKARSMPGYFVRMRHVIRPTLNEPKGAYNATNAYANVQVRPGTTSAQIEAGQAALDALARRLGIDRLGRRPDAGGVEASVLGSRLYAGFKAGKANSLIGQIAHTPGDLAALAQVYRDPRFETFRVVYMQGNIIVGEGGYTSRLPGTVAVPDELEAQIAADMKRFGATGYSLLHNHPSGTAAPSPSDIAMTKLIARSVPGMREHVVIDHNEYAVITARGMTTLVPAPNLNGVDFRGAPELAHRLLGTVVTGPEQLAGFAKQLQQDGQHATLILTDRQGQTQLIVDVPVGVLSDSGRSQMLKAKALIRRMSRDVGAGGHRFVVVPAGINPTFYRAWVKEGVFTEVVAADGGSARATVSSVREDFMDHGRAMRVSQNPPPAWGQSQPGAQGNGPIPTNAQTGMPLQGGANTPSWVVAGPSRLDKFIYQAQDRQINLKRVQEAIEAVRHIPEQFDGYLKEELYHGRVAHRTAAFLDRELRPLLMDLKLKGISMDELEAYLWARHAPERNAQIARINPRYPDGGSGLKDAEAAAYMSGSDVLDQNGAVLIKGMKLADQRRLEALAARVDAITAGTKQVLMQYGLETPTTIAAWDSTYQHYVPLYREDMDGVIPVGQGYSVKGSSSKRALGSARKVTDILARLAMQREAAITRGEKNRVALALYGLAKQNPNPDFWQADKVPTIQTIDKTTGLVTSVPDPLYKSRDNVLMVRVGGADRAIVFNKTNERAMQAVTVLKNLDVQYLNAVLQRTASVTRYFASINTQYNPVFGIVNAYRDAQDMALNLTSTPIAGKQVQVLSNIPGAMRAIWKIERGGRAGNVYDALYESMRAGGGTTGFREMFRVGAERDKALQKELDAMKAGPARKAWHAVLRYLDHFNSAIEDATRLATYRVAVEAGLSPERAASVSKNITINFNRKGAAGTDLNALYAFFNAAVQGSARGFETLRGPAGRRILMGGIALGILQVLIGVAAFGDDAWDDIPQFVKSRNIIIPLPGGGYYQHPMPLFFNMLPNIGRIAAEAALVHKGKGIGTDMWNMISAVLDSVNPLGNSTASQMIAPTVVDPIVALGENKDWAGRPIAKEDVNPLRPTPGYTRARDTSTVPSRLLAQGINALTGGTRYTPGMVSPTPDQLDYIFGVLTGGLGREAYKAYTSAELMAKGQDVPEYRKPIVGRFYGRTDEDVAVSSRFWNNIKDLNALEAEVKGRKKDGIDTTEFFKDNPDAAFIRRGDSVEHQIAKMRSERHRIEFDDKISEADRTARLKDQDALILNTMREFNDGLKRDRAALAK